MLAIPSDVVSSLDLQTGLEVAGKVLMTLKEAHPGELGTGILHFVNPPIFCTQYCGWILDIKLLKSKSQVSLTLRRSRYLLLAARHSGLTPGPRGVRYSPTRLGPGVGGTKEIYHQFLSKLITCRIMCTCGSFIPSQM